LEPGDGIRYNLASLPFDEQLRFRNAVITLHQKYVFPDGVSGWFKQDEIHQATHVHRGPAFIPWHRELCNRFEQLLRDEADPLVSLHYWDWTENPEPKLLGPNGILGASQGTVGSPWDILHNKGIFRGSRADTGKASDPPQTIERFVGRDAPVSFAPRDEYIVTFGDDDPTERNHWYHFRRELEDWHDAAHGCIGGNISIGRHTAFEDPFVFLLHSNVDRLWASWQLQSGKDWRRDPSRIYGIESDAKELNENFAPWEGGKAHPEQKIDPWGNQWPAEYKNAKHDSIVKQIPKYDRYTNISNTSAKAF
jgi:hypothetical protein